MFRALLLAYATSFVIIVNVLANVLPLNGYRTGEIANRVNYYIAPAGYVFSIWSVIYILLVVWTLRSFKDVYVRSQAMTIYYMMISVLNVAWLFSWHYERFALSIVIMFALLVSLIGAYRQTVKERSGFLDQLLFSLYLGWVSMSTMTNVSYVLVYWNWTLFDWPAHTGAIALLCLVVVLAVTVFMVFTDFYFVFVMMWGLIGIAVRQQDDMIMFYGALAAVATLALFLVIMFIQGKRPRFNG